MRASVPQRWRCLRGHDNEAEVRRCDVCRLPWWITRSTLVGAGAILLLGGIMVVMLLSQFLKEWQYVSQFRQFWNDDHMISPPERSQLEQLATYLRVPPEKARQWEAAVSGTKEASLPKPSERGSRSLEPFGTLEQELHHIREALEQGHFSEVRQAVTALATRHPQHTEVQHLQKALDQEVQGRITVKLLGQTYGQSMLNAPVALMVLTGHETDFRLYVEPQEQVHFYLYSVDRSGNIAVLFPTSRLSNGASNPLQPGRAYELPSPDPQQRWYPLKRQGHVVQDLYMVSSRWPARELEQWGTELVKAGGIEAGRNLLKALQGRQQAHVGGCHVRTLQFAGGT